MKKTLEIGSTVTDIFAGVTQGTALSVETDAAPRARPSRARFPTIPVQAMHTVGTCYDS